MSKQELRATVQWYSRKKSSGRLPLWGLVLIASLARLVALGAEELAELGFWHDLNFDNLPGPVHCANRPVNGSRRTGTPSINME